MRQDAAKRPLLKEARTEQPRASLSHRESIWTRGEGFVRACKELGAYKVEAMDLLMDVDLERLGHGHMDTYTQRLADGTRLQCSGPLLLPWKFIAVKMGKSG